MGLDRAHIDRQCVEKRNISCDKIAVLKRRRLKMSSIRIPKSSYSAIQNLTHLRAADFDDFLEAVSSSRPTLNSDSFRRQVASKLPNIDRSIIESVVNELFALDHLRDNLEVTGEELSKLISEAALEAQSEEFPFRETDREILQARLAKIFELRQAVSLSSKAQDLLTDQDRVFYTAKILTDVRPVFNAPGDSIDAAIIIHNLRIHYGQGDDHKDFYVSMDTSDIQSLREVLDRADAKARCLQDLLQRSGVSYLDADE